MRDGLLEAGKIVNTHGVRGEVRIEPWANSPVFLTDFSVLYIDGQPRKVVSSRVHKNCVITAFEDVSGIEGAIALKNKVVFINRRDARLDDGEHFVADLTGLSAIDDDTGETLGVVREMFSLPANDVYVVSGGREIMIPAVPEFVREINVEGGYIRFHLIEGM